jgi:hypothetical protein
MSYLKKLIKKSDSDPWEFYIEVSKSVSSLPDSRDLEIENDEDSSKVYGYTREWRHQFPGYSGWDREYIDDNTLLFKYYVDSVDTATKMLLEHKNKSIELQNINLSSNILSKISSSNISSYKISWSYVDDDGNETIFKR